MLHIVSISNLDSFKYNCLEIDSFFIIIKYLANVIYLFSIATPYSKILFKYCLISILIFSIFIYVKEYYHSN